MLEYEEIIALKFGKEVAKDIIRLLLMLENVTLVTPYFKWDLIPNDQDDNKFVDCCLISNSDALVTHDRYFDSLKTLEFPKVNVITIETFKKMF